MSKSKEVITFSKFKEDLISSFPGNDSKILEELFFRIDKCDKIESEWAKEINKDMLKVMRQNFELKHCGHVFYEDQTVIEIDGCLYINMPCIFTRIRPISDLLFTIMMAATVSTSLFFSVNGTYFFSYEFMQIIGDDINKAILKNKGKVIQKSKQTYLMADANGFVKIGRSQDPKYRETTLQSENPSITMFAVNDKDVEKELHKKYYRKRVRGEWFSLDANDLKFIMDNYNFKAVIEQEEK